MPRLATTTRSKHGGLSLFQISVAALPVLVGAVVYLWYKRDWYNTRGLPESYALCTYNTAIYTVHAAKPKVDCVLIEHDKIAATGSMYEVKAHWNEVQNLRIQHGIAKHHDNLKIVHAAEGMIVIPGLADAHAHIVEYGFKMRLPLDQAESLDDIITLLESYVNANPDVLANPDFWIEAMGWDQNLWKNWTGQFPSAADLATSPLLTGRPIALRGIDGHTMWLSPRALKITQATLPDGHWPDIEGGEILRNSDGVPTGIFLDNAIELVPTPPWSESLMEEFTTRTFKDALSVGLTSVHDAAASIDMIRLFQRMADEGTMPIRVYAMGYSDSTDYWGDTIPRLECYGKEHKLDVRSIKLFADGELSSWGAAMLEPYSDNPSTSGILRFSAENLHRTIARFWKDGWSVNVHSVGDYANDVILDAFESLFDGGGHVAETRRPRIEHAQVMRPEHVRRVGNLGIITSVQPSRATSDMWFIEKRVGQTRAKNANLYQTLLQASPNHILPLGSDFPVENINPLLSFYAAVSRLSVNGESPHGAGGWFPSERLTRTQALKGMTLDAAYAAFAENRYGSLEPGKKADFVLLNRDIMCEDCPIAKILDARVQATVIDGKIMYGTI